MANHFSGFPHRKFSPERSDVEQESTGGQDRRNRRLAFEIAGWHSESPAGIRNRRLAFEIAGIAGWHLKSPAGIQNRRNQDVLAGIQNRRNQDVLAGIQNRRNQGVLAGIQIAGIKMCWPSDILEPMAG